MAQEGKERVVLSCRLKNVNNAKAKSIVLTDELIRFAIHLFFYLFLSLVALIDELVPFTTSRNKKGNRKQEYKAK